MNEPIEEINLEGKERKPPRKFVNFSSIDQKRRTEQRRRERSRSRE